MSTYYAAVKYPVHATTTEKIRALRDGLQMVAMELIDLGCSLDQVEEWLAEARMSAEDEYDAIRALPGAASASATGEGEA